MRLRSSVAPALADAGPTRPPPRPFAPAQPDPAGNDDAPLAAADGVDIDPAIVVATDPAGAVAQQMREARAMVLGADDARDDRTPILVFAGGADGHATPVIAANFAVASAQLGYRVLLVDAVLGAPMQHRLFHRDNAVGLAELIGTGRAPVAAATAVERLTLITAGDGARLADGLIERGGVCDALRQTARAFDLVVIDAGAGEPNIVAATAVGTRGVILVAERHRSAVRKLQALAGGLAARNVAMLGSIVVG